MGDLCQQTGRVNAHHVAASIVALALFGVILVIGLSTIKGMQKLKKLNSIIRGLYYFCFICCVASPLCHISVTLVCILPNNLSPNIFRAIYYFVYISLLITMLSTLFVRLHCTFKESVYRLSFIHKIIMLSIFCILWISLISALTSQIIYSLNHRDRFMDTPGFLIFAVISCTIYILSSIYAVTLFVNNLMKLVKSRATSFKNVLDENAKKLNQHQTKLINQISRYVSLISLGIFISVIMTTVAVLVHFRRNREKDATFVEYWLATLILVDNTLNLIFMSLQYKFTDTFYQKYCKCISSFWFCIFSTFAEKSIESNLKQIMEMQCSNSTNTNPSYNTNPSSDIEIKYADSHTNRYMDRTEEVNNTRTRKDSSIEHEMSDIGHGEMSTRL